MKKLNINFEELVDFFDNYSIVELENYKAMFQFVFDHELKNRSNTDCRKVVIKK